MCSSGPVVTHFDTQHRGDLRDLASRDEFCGVPVVGLSNPLPRGLLLRSVTYSMNVSLDGFIVGPDGGFDWGVPDEGVFRFWIDEIREVGVHLLGRRLYETMLYWETADQDRALDDAELEGRAKPLPKVVFSTTLSAVQRAMPAWPPAAWRRRSSGCGPSRGRATSRSAARRSPPRRPRWV